MQFNLLTVPCHADVTQFFLFFIFVWFVLQARAYLIGLCTAHRDVRSDNLPIDSDEVPILC
jgi:hypothetical protein